MSNVKCQMSIHWSAPEYTYHEKDVSWYWLVIIFAIIISAISLWQRNFLFAVFVIIATAMIIAWARRQPDMIDFELDDDGLKVNEKKYIKDHFESFSIKEHDEEWDELFLKTKSKISRYVALPIPHYQIDKIKEYCLNSWAEAEHKDSLVDEISEFIKF